MGAREELAAILRDAAEKAVAAGLPVLTFDGYADAVVAAGWRPAPTLLTDPAELDDLPAGTVILDAMSRPMQLCDNRW
jgi:alpha-beta hydrolase superfamily lysophospholipase